MLKRHEKDFVDLSLELSDASDWGAGILKSLECHLDITAVATEPISGLLAVGTSRGTIILYGSPGVECTLTLSDPPGARIKFLLFGSAVFKLLAVDDHHRLHIWDLSIVGRPKLQKIVSLSHSVNCITAPPSLTHAFIAMDNGTIQSYDLLCLRTSPYTIPNLWALHEEKLSRSGFSTVRDVDAHILVDIMVHPRDLNLLFIAYGGGIILFDLKEQHTVRVYQLVLPPGAPGGMGYHNKDLLTTRHPAVTALALHPSGHVFVVGHADGSIAFWALEDEDKPLFVRTINSAEDEDVSAVDAVKIATQQPDNQTNDTREPIFKLAWSGFPNSSDPRGGETVLSVLGGLLTREPPGLTTLLFPPLQPPAPPDTQSQAQSIALHPETRNALRTALVPKDSYPYVTLGLLQDFWLIPRESPHFGGVWDPTAVLILSDSIDSKARVLEAWDFPPPSYKIRQPETIPAHTNAEDTTPSTPFSPNEELTSILQSICLTTEPHSLALPLSLTNILRSVFVKLSKSAYEVAIRESEGGKIDDIVPLRGGMAWLEDEDGRMKMTKYQPHRILITSHPDLKIRFADLSGQLLMSTSSDIPLKNMFPDPLLPLTIDLSPLICDPELAIGWFPEHPPSRPSSAAGTSVRSDKGKEQEPRVQPEDYSLVDRIYLAPESLECVVTMRSGAVVLYRLGSGGSTGLSGPPSSPLDEELVSLQHTVVQAKLRYRPLFAIRPVYGPVSACAVCDIGFLAVAYTSGAILVVDIRGPHVILRAKPPQPERSFLLLHSHHDADPVLSLVWTICGLASDPALQIRLIATHASGSASVYTVHRSMSEHSDSSNLWTMTDPPVNIDSSRPFASGQSSFVLDAKRGIQIPADSAGLAQVLGTDLTIERDQSCILVCAGGKGARCLENLTGDRIARVEWGKAGPAVCAEVVERSSGCALVAFNERGEALVYSLPLLDLMHTVQMPLILPSIPSTDTAGDFITTTMTRSQSPPHRQVVQNIRLMSLFANHRSAPFNPPFVDLSRGRGTLPAQPQPVPLGPTSVIGSFLGYLGVGATRADEVDALLAGPDRPAPPQSGLGPRPGFSTASKATDGTSMLSQVDAASATMSSGVGDLYNRLGNALAERGQMLGDLEESFNSLEKGSKNMLSQAKNIAAQQTAKRWFDFSS